MNTISKLFLSGLVVIIGLLAVGCPDRTSIRDIEANPSKYQNKEVVVAGTVRDSYGVNIPGTKIRGGAYKIDDGTGSIWIVTENARADERCSGRRERDHRQRRKLERKELRDSGSTKRIDFGTRDSLLRNDKLRATG
jgi:hypothetical protein